jgi:hypothetical protein
MAFCIYPTVDVQTMFLPLAAIHMFSPSSLSKARTNKGIERNKIGMLPARCSNCRLETASRVEEEGDTSGGVQRSGTGEQKVLLRNLENSLLSYA